jgi:hypothetical protein
LTITLKKFIERFSSDTELAESAAGMTSSAHPVVQGSLAGA